MNADENKSSLWLLVIADHVRYMVYAVMTDDCRRPDLGFAIIKQQAQLQRRISETLAAPCNNF